MTYCSTPFPWCKLSPAELLMGRCLCANIPLVTKQMIPEWNFMNNFRVQNTAFKEQQKREYDRRHGVQNPPIWMCGLPLMKNRPLALLSNQLHDHVIETPIGQVRRNRQHLNIAPGSYKSTTLTDSPTRDPIVTRSRSGTTVLPTNRL